MPKKGAPEEPLPTSKEQNLKNKSKSREKKFGIEIEEIFASKLKRKNPEEPLPGPKELISKKNKSNSREKKPGNETNEIFSSNKRRNAQEEQRLKQKEGANSKPKRVEKKKVKVSEKDGFVDQPSKPRKRTGDGLVVYSEEELGIGKSDAGGTSLCPFDCSCCF